MITKGLRTVHLERLIKYCSDIYLSRTEESKIGGVLKRILFGMDTYR